MPDLLEVFDRLKATRREYHVVADAIERLRAAVRANEVASPPETSLRDYDSAIARLEPTYLVRLWAEFETALRSSRRHVVGNPAENLRASDLIDWCRAFGGAGRSGPAFGTSSTKSANTEIP